MQQKSPNPEAEETARILLDTGAVNFNADKPYIFTSGWASPVYIDCRRLVSYPRERRRLMQMGTALLKREAAGVAFDMIAGGETAGIPFAAWLSEELDLPMVYVRKQPKGFGRMAQIEGHLKENAHVLLVEDLASDGKSKVKFVDALRKADAKCGHAFVIFHYGIFPQSEANMKEIGVKLHALATWWDVLAVARARKSFDGKTLAAVEAFLNDPVAWSAAHGGKTGTEG